MGELLEHSIVQLLAGTRSGARIALAVGLLACSGSALGASTTTNAIPGGLTVRRSMRAAPHRLIVHPSGATLIANQTQRFGVTDAQGNPVSVRWNVSGIGCSGSSCGTIDEQGIYHPPSSLPQPGIITVEGVLVSDPNYSVLTEVRLEPAATVAAKPSTQAPVRKVQEKVQEIAAPVVERQSVASRTELPPLPSAIAAAPGLGKQNVSGRSVLPLPNAVAAAPVVEAGKVTRDGKLPPVPEAIAAAPAVERQSVTRNGEFPPLPRVVAATPAIEKQTVFSRGTLPPLPHAVGAAPEIGKQKVVHSIELPLPTVVTVALEVERRDVARKVELPPVPKAVGAAPEVGGSTLSNADNARPLPRLVASLSPASSQIYSEKTQLPTGIAKQKPAGGETLPPMQDVVAAVPTGSSSPQHASAVTYSDGQLTINAENLTLAAVLRLVAEKTGAVIDVPPGTGLERIFEHAGPGKPEDVLASLLNGSPFDFVIVGSPQRQHAPTQVLLSLHSADDKNASLPPPPKTVGSPAAWTPPAPADTASVYVPPDLDGRDLVPPKEPLSPEVLDQMMKERTKLLRERIQQQ